MSSVLNMVGGGAGGAIKPENAILLATVPTESTVTATKGAITLTPTMWVTAEDSSMDCALFVIPASEFDATTPWTITSTDGESTTSTRIYITDNKEYEVELSYAFYLVKDGVALVTFNPPTGTTLTQSDNQLVWDSGAVALLKVVTDLTNFNRMVAVLGTGKSWRGGQVPGLGYSASNPTINTNNGIVNPYTGVTFLNTQSGAISAGQYEVDISSETGNQYVWFSASYIGYSEHAIIRIIDWYLV